MELFSWPVRVYYEDTDAGGVVYHASYLCFLERARTEWLRSLGLEQDVLRQRDNILFAVRHIDIAYLKPARFNDQLDVTAAVATMGRASFEFDQTITRRSEATVLCRATVKVACVGATSFKPCAIPNYIKAEMICDN